MVWERGRLASVGNVLLSFYSLFNRLSYYHKGEFFLAEVEGFSSFLLRPYRRIGEGRMSVCEILRGLFK